MNGREGAPDIRRDLLIGLLPLLAAAGVTWWSLRLPAAYLLGPAALHLALSGLILRYPPPPELEAGLGAANRVTLLRATLIFSVAGLIPIGADLGPFGAWWIIVASALTIFLDGVDGRLARRTGTTSAFGARFDMELDAFLILVLSMLVWLTGQVGPWVILIGALRYLFVGAGWIQPALRTELPPSRRRQTVCVVQGLVLLVCLAPVVPPPIAAGVAGGSLALLAYSFGVDVAWLLTSAAPPSVAPDARG